MYDGDDAEVDCGITSSNQGRMCSVSFEFNKTVDGPLYVYYELDKFYQNHRRYVSSLDYYQLNGQVNYMFFFLFKCRIVVWFTLL